MDSSSACHDTSMPSPVPGSSPVIVITGNPNVGKTTLFNALTGARQKIANYPGVTVERKEGHLVLEGGLRARIIDIPGAYSLTARSDDEQVAHDVITGNLHSAGIPSLAIYVADASNLERTLFLYSQIRDLGIPVLIALNMTDIAAARGIVIDVPKLSQNLGVPVIPVVGHRKTGIRELRSAIAEAMIHPVLPSSRPWPLRAEVEQEACALGQWLKPKLQGRPVTPEAEALWLMSAVEDPRAKIRLDPETRAEVKRHLELLSAKGIDVRTETIQGRYAWLNQLSREVQTRTESAGPIIHDRIDMVITHRVAGPLIFLVVMAVMFQAVFAWADPLIGLVENAVSWLSELASSHLPEGLVTDMLVEGVLGGVGNVVVFLPQILILFFFISLLEDVGYMSRAALVSHRLMSRMGLPGKAFIPLMSSFACAIPGIMSARTIEDRRDRLVTICIAPLISCSARLPVYALVIAAIFEADRPVFLFFTEGGLVMLSMYLLSIVMAVTAAAIIKRTVLPAPAAGFIMELPPYRIPRWGDTLINMIQRSKVFLTEAGTIILGATLILWLLLSFPRTGPEIDAAVAARDSLKAQAGADARPGLDDEIALAEQHVAQERLHHSYAGSLGRILEPAIEPLGFDWKIGIGLVGSFAAREVLVSTLGIVYGAGSVDPEDTQPLRDRIRTERDPATGKPVFTPLVGMSLMVFFVLACQCMSTLAIIKRETNSWRWPAFVFTYMTVLAWTGSFVVYQGGRLLGFE